MKLDVIKLDGGNQQLQRHQSKRLRKVVKHET